MNNVISLDKKRLESQMIKGDAAAFRVVCRAIMDERLDRDDLRLLARTVLERRPTNVTQTYLETEKIAESCKKFTDFGYLESDGPFEHIFEDGESAGWFQIFRIKGLAA